MDTLYVPFSVHINEVLLHEVQTSKSKVLLTDRQGKGLVNIVPFQIEERESLQILLSLVLAQEFPAITSQLFLLRTCPDHG